MNSLGVAYGSSSISMPVHAYWHMILVDQCIIICRINVSYLKSIHPKLLQRSSVDLPNKESDASLEFD